MRLLFEMDKKDHARCTHTFTRNSARSIMIRDGKAAMIHSQKADYYKFPGGGIENGEDPVEAMIRETREEAGLIVVPESVREYGYVHRVQRSETEASERFVQDTYYYLCRAEDTTVPQQLEDYEAREAFRLEYVEPLAAIDRNNRAKSSTHDRQMLDREVRVLEMLISEGVIEWTTE